VHTHTTSWPDGWALPLGRHISVPWTVLKHMLELIGSVAHDATAYAQLRALNEQHVDLEANNGTLHRRKSIAELDMEAYTLDSKMAGMPILAVHILFVIGLIAELDLEAYTFDLKEGRYADIHQMT
jgi:hypothetical protein